MIQDVLEDPDPLAGSLKTGRALKREAGLLADRPGQPQVVLVEAAGSAAPRKRHRAAHLPGDLERRAQRVVVALAGEDGVGGGRLPVH